MYFFCLLKCVDIKLSLKIDKLIIIATFVLDIFVLTTIIGSKTMVIYDRSVDNCEQHTP